jgi:hypothetical protein
MGNQYENDEFRNAVRAAGVRGKDWNDQKATKACSEAFHNSFSKSERDSMSYSEMVNWASDWWSINSHRYS